MILVTGGTGFVGRHVVHALRAQDRDVRCLVRKPDRATTLRGWGCELVEGDVTDAASVRAALDGADAVVHLVSIIRGRPEEFDRTMSAATRELVAASRAAGVSRIVLMSALGTGEETKDLVPYYRAKWEMEQAVRQADVGHVILRPSFVFGRDGGVLPLFVRQVRWSPLTTVLGDGTRRLQPIWVEDLAAFVAASIDLDAAAGRTFELGGPDQVTWDELYERIKRTLGVRRPTVHIPFPLARAGAALAELLPRPPLTRDQLTMLAAGDNVCDMRPALETFELGVIPLDEQLRRAT